MQIILLSGPPGAGKRTAAANMRFYEPVSIVKNAKFSDFIAACDLVGGKNVLVMRVHRPGCDGWNAETDTPHYIDDSFGVFGNKSVTIINDMDLGYFLSETHHFASMFVARANRGT